MAKIYVIVFAARDMLLVVCVVAALLRLPPASSSPPLSREVVSIFINAITEKWYLF